MGSLGRRLRVLEGGSRDRALGELVEHIRGLSDEEIAAMFTSPRNPPASADWERQEALMYAAGAHEEERMKVVVKAILGSLETRKKPIRKLMEEMGYAWGA